MVSSKTPQGSGPRERRAGRTDVVVIVLGLAEFVHKLADALDGGPHKHDGVHVLHYGVACPERLDEQDVLAQNLGLRVHQAHDRDLV